MVKKLDRGIKVSKVNETLNGSIDIAVLYGKLQQNGVVRIVFDPALYEEPLVQLTGKGRQELIELFFSSDPKAMQGE